MRQTHAADPGAWIRDSVRVRIQEMQDRINKAGHRFREPPQEPTTCCGRGCQGCVWEGYEAALTWWFEEASLLQGIVPLS